MTSTVRSIATCGDDGKMSLIIVMFVLSGLATMAQGRDFGFVAKNLPPHMGPHELGVPIHFAKGEHCWECVGKVHGYGAITFYGDFLPSQRIVANGILSSSDRCKKPVVFHLKENMYVNGPPSGGGDFRESEDPIYYTKSAGRYLLSTDWLDDTEQTKVIFQICAYEN